MKNGQIPAKVRSIGFATTGLCVLDLQLVTFFALFLPSRPLSILLRLFARDLLRRRAQNLGSLRIAREHVCVQLMLLP